MTSETPRKRQCTCRCRQLSSRWEFLHENHPPVQTRRTQRCFHLHLHFCSQRSQRAPAVLPEPPRSAPGVAGLCAEAAAVPRGQRASQSFIHPRAPSGRERLLSPQERNLPNSITDTPGEKPTEGAPDRRECRLRGPGTEAAVSDAEVLFLLRKGRRP